MLVSDVSSIGTVLRQSLRVLILVLVDVGLGRFFFLGWAAKNEHVLILVLVDVGLGLMMLGFTALAEACLNPCFSGCWSRTSEVQDV